MKDCRGQELAVGDTVVYPHAQGSSGASLMVATVVELTTKKASWSDDLEEKVRVQRHFNSRARLGSWGEVKPSLVTPEFTLKVVLP